MTKDLGWLWKLDRTLPTPELVILPGLITPDEGECSGFYVDPTDCELMVGDRFYDCKNGLIAVNADIPDVHSTIAHEYRHHWQRWRGIESDAFAWAVADSKTNWEQSTASYYARSRTEMDALLFELSVAPSDENREAFDIVRRYAESRYGVTVDSHG